MKLRICGTDISKDFIRPKANEKSKAKFLRVKIMNFNSDVYFEIEIEFICFKYFSHPFAKYYKIGI